MNIHAHSDASDDLSFLLDRSVAFILKPEDPDTFLRWFGEYAQQTAPGFFAPLTNPDALHSFKAFFARYIWNRTALPGNQPNGVSFALFFAFAISNAMVTIRRVGPFNYFIWITRDKKTRSRPQSPPQSLKPGEQKLLDACRTGEPCQLEQERPEQATEANTVGGSPAAS